MNRLIKNRKYRLLLLRCSSLPLATVLLTGMAILSASRVFALGEWAWLILLGSLLALAIMAVLLRTGPDVWRDVFHYRRLSQPARMRAMQHHVAWSYQRPSQLLIEHCEIILAEQAYACIQTRQDGVSVLSATRGRWNRLSFILTHIASLLILMGLLLDSDLWLRYQSATGQLHAETRPIPLNEMAVQSRIKANSSMAFQAYAQLQPGQKADEVRLMTEHGALARHLPFAVAVDSVELDTSHLAHENIFLTRIAILDPRLNEPVRAVLGSNRPFHYRGFDYYQQAVLDGGSELTVSMWPLGYSHAVPLTIRSRVGNERQLETREGAIHIRFSDLKPRNINSNLTDQQTAPHYKNIGPSLSYHVNDQAGREREFINYMLPVLRNERYFFISGYRRQTDDSFHFIHLPADQKGSLQQFFELYAAMYDQPRLARAIKQVLHDAGKTVSSKERDEFEATVSELFSLFRSGGMQAVNDNIKSRVDAAAYQQSLQLSHKLVRSLLYALYKQTLSSEKINETALLFFEDAFAALAVMADADMPFYIQLQDMVYKPMVNLLVSYKPGQLVFFTGCLLLLAGLISSFYNYHRRIWITFETEGDSTIVSVSGMGGRQSRYFSREFNRLFTQLQKSLNAC